MDEDQPGKVSTPPDARLDSLEQRLGKAKAAEEARTGSGKAEAGRDDKLGNRVLSYLLGGLLGGTLIGWVLDNWFGTSPKLLLAGLVLGMVGGFWSIIRVATRGR